MVLDKITQRAKNVLTAFSKDSELPDVLVRSLIDTIAAEGGLGYTLLIDYPDIVIKSKDQRINIEDVLEQAFLEAVELKHPYVGTEHFVLAIFKLLGSKEYKSLQKKLISTGTYPPTAKRTINSSKKTPILDAFGTNINLLYEEGLISAAVEREEVFDIQSILLQKKKANPLLVGDSGVGKSSLIRLLSKKIADFEVPAALLNFQIIELDMLGFLSTIMGREGVETGLNALHDEIISVGDVVLFVPDIHHLFMPPGAGSLPPFAGSLFKSIILYSGIPTIATTTPLHFQRTLQEDDEINELFSILKVKEPSKDITLAILDERASDLEKYHGINISEDIVEFTYSTAEKYMKNKKFPQKGIDLLDKASSLLLLEKTMLPKKYGTLKKKKLLLSESLNKAVITKKLTEGVKIRKKLQDIDSQLSHIQIDTTKLDVTRKHLMKSLSKEIDVPIGDNENFEDNIYSNLESRLSKRVIGQTKAAKAVSSALVRSRIGLRSKTRPIGNFMFLGPTGIGKTELAKVLADEVFGSNGLIKLDMSDFAEKHNVSRLVGAPPGYIGYSEGGELTEKIAKNPYSVVLFDEIEKAHPDVLNILLQIMDDGILVDARGRGFDFTHSIIILTSNLGSELIKKGSLGFSLDPKELNALSDEAELNNEHNEKKLIENLKQILKPELLNRFDDVIVFNRLSKPDMKSILNLMLKEVTSNLREKNYDLHVSEKAKEFLLKQGYSDEYGARALRRTLDKQLLDPIANLIITGQAKKAACIRVGYKNGLTFTSSKSF